MRLLHTNHSFVSRLKVLYSCSYSRKVICQNDGCLTACGWGKTKDILQKGLFMHLQRAVLQSRE